MLAKLEDPENTSIKTFTKIAKRIRKNEYKIFWHRIRFVKLNNKLKEE